ncbi:ribose 5-phosphate isomerase B [Bernardetia sp.]|uniref:ribose 5-phosphate isomerase B n=1 Tax=Bernardetia sp. TaxID=1937974 RepID=UPI0025B8FFAC|nr:ribose 5-phosphate isomerase B [Bernardetia sp.]
MKISIANDHAGTAYKEYLTNYLTNLGHEVKNFGTDSSDSVDYPDFAHPLAESITKKETELGILICGSGNGIAMTANKHAQIRAAICWNEELAALARQHNNANVICIPARFVSQELAQKMVETFLKTDFEGGRHERRVEKISC